MSRRKPYFLTIFSLILFCFFNSEIRGQELPILNQKLTNSFLYNPAQAGLNLGSITLVHKKNWNDVAGSPISNVGSIHYPFARGRAGIGLNYVNDQTNIFNNTYLSLGTAYHIIISDFSSFSFGVSADYSNTKADATKINVIDENDVVISNLLGESKSYFDFSFGLDYRSKYFSIGGAYNRLSSSFIVDESKSFLQDYITGYLDVTLPVSGKRDLFEPMVTYRKISADDGLIDAGLYYTYNDLLMVGGAYGNNGAWNVQAGVQFSKFYLGYVYENFSGKTNKDLGSNNEIIFRFDFSKAEGYKNRYASNVQKTKNAISYRRKSLYKPPVGAKNPQKFSKSWKKKNNRSYSPNKRYNPKKLYTVKIKYPKKKRRKH